jgi:hypothetical protein
MVILLAIFIANIDLLLPILREGSPWENGYIESFNGKPDEILIS